MANISDINDKERDCEQMVEGLETLLEYDKDHLIKSNDIKL